MSALLAEYPTIAGCGTAENQGHFYDRFEHVICLYVPLGCLSTQHVPGDVCLVFDGLAVGVVESPAPRHPPPP